MTTGETTEGRVVRVHQMSGKASLTLLGTRPCFFHAHHREVCIDRGIFERRDCCNVVGLTRCELDRPSAPQKGCTRKQC